MIAEADIEEQAVSDYMAERYPDLPEWVRLLVTDANPNTPPATGWSSILIVEDASITELDAEFKALREEVAYQRRMREELAEERNRLMEELALEAVMELLGSALGFSPRMEEDGLNIGIPRFDARIRFKLIAERASVQ